MQHFLHLCGAKQLRGVGRDISRHHNVPVFVYIGLIHLGIAALEEIRKSRLILVSQLLCDTGETKVAVYEQYSLSVLCKSIGKIYGGGALSLASYRACNADYGAFQVIGKDKVKICTQHLVLFLCNEAKVLVQRFFIGNSKLMFFCFRHYFIFPALSIHFHNAAYLP